MSQKAKAKITKATTKDFTCITFKPDLQKFGMSEIDNDHESLLRKRVYDLAGCVSKVKVFLNGERINITSFKQYVEMYLRKPGEEGPPKKKVKRASASASASRDATPMRDATPLDSQQDMQMTLQFASQDMSQSALSTTLFNSQDMSPSASQSTTLFNSQQGEDASIKQEDDILAKLESEPSKSSIPLIFEREKISDRWEVIVTASDGQFQQISFVNSICTAKGGTHVDYIANQIVNKVAEALKKRNKNAAAAVKNHLVKQHLWVFINCLINNPAFDSQTKEYMTLKSSAFGSKYIVSDKFMDKIVKSSITESIMSFVRFRQDQSLKKTDGAKRTRISGIAKLDDANNAGGRSGNKCTLILTEGDSAKALAVSGLSVIGRDNYGVFPLRGKMLNVREASSKQVSDNTEINHVKQILGLQHGKEYTDTSSLRYGHLMIMTDQDHDGSHIKGLIINFLDYYYPSLLKIPGFLVEFITPIVKATKGTKEIAFYTMPEYETWKEKNDNGKGWKVKYYKGLGTSTAADAKKYFSDLTRHRKSFGVIKDPERLLVDMAFNKKRADHRKEWLRQLEPGTFMDHTAKEISISDFINKELILFSQADNVRSIPNELDGMKPGQRKILYSCFKRKLKAEIKVQQLCGYVSEHTAYHHGDVSLQATVVNLAQNFVGSNNINLLMPDGQFGSRGEGGKDAASARYIFTRLSPIARKLFPPEDDPLLNYLHDDGLPIEPDWYIPIIPMVLVNGSEGIGTGWSTSVPCYNPEEIVANLRRKMQGEPMVDMLPWYRGFKGSIEPDGPGKFKVTGIIKKIDSDVLEITELPVGFWTQSYKEFIEAMEIGTDKVPAFIKKYDANHTDMSVHYYIYLTEENMAKAEAEGLEKKFRLVRSINTSNMVCHDARGKLRKFSSPLEILEDFYPIRLEYYGKRKAMLAHKYGEEVSEMSERVRFVTEIIKGTLVIQNRKRKDVVAELQKKGYKTFHVKKAKEIVAGMDVEEAEAALEAEKDNANGYNYLLSMSLWHLTWEKVEQLKKERDATQASLDTLLKKSATDLWNEDLDAFSVEYQNVQKEFYAAMDGSKPLKASKIKKPRATKKAIKNGVERETAVKEGSAEPDMASVSSTPQKRKREDSGEPSPSPAKSIQMVKPTKKAAAPKAPKATKPKAAKSKPKIESEDEIDEVDMILDITPRAPRPARKATKTIHHDSDMEENDDSDDYMEE